MDDATFRNLMGKEKQGAVPRFFRDAVHMTGKSAVEGRPIYENREFVEIIIPGDLRNRPVEPVNDEHKARWPEAYAAFQRDEELPPDGTPLKTWPMVNAAQVKELAHFDVHTIEQLAVLNDAHVSNLGMGARELREKAKTFLDVSRNGTGPLERLIHRADAAEADRDTMSRRLDEAVAEIERLRQEVRSQHVPS